MNEKNHKMKDNKVIHSIELDREIYSLSAIKKAAYDFSKIAWIVIKESSNHSILVEFKIINDTKCEKTFRQEFLNHVLDHQVRIDVTEEFKIIREMIVAQAFEPCENLAEIVEKLIHEE